MMTFKKRFFTRLRSSARRRRSGAASAERFEARLLLTTFLVTTTNDNGSGSLRSAMLNADANPGFDQIRFDRNLTGQTISLSSSLPQILDSVDIRGRGTSFDAITIDGQFSNGVRPFAINDTATNVTLANMTITGGNTTGLMAPNSPDGGGVLNDGPNTLLINVRIHSNNAVGNGGGLGNTSDGKLTLRYSEVSGNIAQMRGGGIATDGELILEGSTVDSNLSGQGGGVDASPFATTTISRSSILSNSSLTSGGGIENRGNLVMDASLIAYNSAFDGGGGLDHGPNDALIRNSTFAHNISRGGNAGGGIKAGGTMTLINSTVVRNISLSNDNDSFGGIYQAGFLSVLEMYNTVVAENEFVSGGQEMDPAELDANVGNIIALGLVRLGPLQDNGGPTMTIAPLPESIVINAGSNAVATVNGNVGAMSLQGDARGLSRFVQEVFGANPTVDVGAVEFNPGPDVPIITGSGVGDEPRVTVYNQDGTVRFSFLAFDNPNFTGGVRVASGDVNGDGVADIIAAKGPGNQSLIRVFDGISGALMGVTVVFDSSYSGGINVASADINGDGQDDIIVGSGGGITGEVRILSGFNLNVTLDSFIVTHAGNTDEVRVATGDTDGDGTPDVIVTTNNRVKVFDGGNSATVLHSFVPFGDNYAGGLFVASGDVNGDGFADIIVGRGKGKPRVQAYAGSSNYNPGKITTFLAAVGEFSDGIRVGARDVDGDGRAEIVTSQGPNGDGVIRVYSLNAFTRYNAFEAFSDEFLDGTNGLFVAIG